MSALNPAAAAAPAVSDLAKTDPEYARFFKHFDEEEVAKTVEPVLGKAHRHFVILAALLGCGGKEEFEVRLPQALDAGVTPIQIREIVYQATAYLGMGRVRGFVDTMNRVFTSRGVKLPLPDTIEQKDVERVVKGEAAQVEIFGPRMKDFASSSPEKTVAIRRWLSANCFGDYYVRSGFVTAGTRTRYLLLPGRARRHHRSDGSTRCRQPQDGQQRGNFDRRLSAACTSPRLPENAQRSRGR